MIPSVHLLLWTPVQDKYWVDYIQINRNATKFSKAQTSYEIME